MVGTSGRLRIAFRAADGNRAQLALLGVARAVLNAKKVRSTWPDTVASIELGRALEGHVHHVDLGHRFEQLGRQMRSAAGTARTVIELARVGPGVGDQFLQVLDRQVRN